MPIFKRVTLLFLGWAVMIAATPVMAAPPVRDNRPQQFSTAALPAETGSSDVFLTAGPGMAILSGEVGWALNAGGMARINESNIFVGADLGVNGWGHATGVQLLPTAFYRFEIKGPLFPYVGLALGPNIYSQDGADTKILFEILGRLGVFVRLNEDISLQFEAKHGFLSDNFIFLPQANAVFSL